jgi:hypothetical protein
MHGLRFIGRESARTKMVVAWAVIREQAMSKKKKWVGDLKTVQRMAPER